MHHMTTTRPRITVNLEPVTAQQLKRISELTGNSQSSMISEVLEQAAPVFERLILVLEAAEKAKERARESVDAVRVKSVERLNEAQQRIETQLGLVLEDFTQSTEPIIEDLEKVSRRRRSGAQAEARTAAAARVPTPISNRGVRLTRKATEIIATEQGSEKVKSGKRAVKSRGGRNGAI